MGNKVIKVSSSDSSENSEAYEVYRDISMVSERRVMSELVKYYNSKGEVVISQKGVKRFIASKEVNVKAVFDSLNNIFTWILGERILNPDFGSRLRYYLYEGITPENKEQIVAEIRGTCLKWEPRVNIVSVKATDNVLDAEDNTVTVDIVFTIPSLSDKQYQYSYIYDRTK